MVGKNSAPPPPIPLGTKLAGWENTNVEQNISKQLRLIIKDCRMIDGFYL
jgi:predicted DNA-binding transcriptional regulator AlpA